MLMLTKVVAEKDEMIELGEREATEAVAEKEAAETAAHAALMKEANLEVPISYFLLPISYFLNPCLQCCTMRVWSPCHTPHYEMKSVMARGRLLAPALVLTFLYEQHVITSSACLLGVSEQTLLSSSSNHNVFTANR